ncbi:hypothetical protein DUNSADRAFT_2508 [Dunaliella salina]|uniref:Encoded protein n=1 Tax=Dunaliella salina TaxID=3046 RepID=A0ABQ7GVF9_DUNSA|nr:hypothetical protein DUNSADRAFT_2508 [Dunaliella salina]|eukprot:KAF5838599.1 hypothetical protein DUNSADRAFT_2508 [Dunaliella salina]
MGNQSVNPRSSSSGWAITQSSQETAVIDRESTHQPREQQQSLGHEPTKPRSSDQIVNEGIRRTDGGTDRREMDPSLSRLSWQMRDCRCTWDKVCSATSRLKAMLQLPVVQLQRGIRMRPCAMFDDDAEIAKTRLCAAHDIDNDADDV